MAVVHAFSPSTWEIEGGGSTEQVPGQQRLHRETMFGGEGGLKYSMTIKKNRA